MLPEEEFRARVIPVLAGLFASPDQSIRTSLLDNIADYAAALPEAAVEGTIFPQLSKGLTQPNAFLREATLKALLPIAPKLSQRTLTGPLLKHLAKLQVRPAHLRALLRLCRCAALPSAVMHCPSCTSAPRSAQPCTLLHTPAHSCFAPAPYACMCCQCSFPPPAYSLQVGAVHLAALPRSVRR